jgi:anti-anti-sigma factor
VTSATDTIHRQHAGRHPDELPGFTAYLDPDGCPVIEGELDINSLDVLRTVLDQALLEPVAIISVDASGLNFVDPVGICELLRYAVVASAKGRRLWLEGVHWPVAVVLDLFDLGHVLMRPPSAAGAPRTHRQAEVAAGRVAGPERVTRFANG